MTSLRKCIAAIGSLALVLAPARPAGSMFVGDPIFRGHSTFVQEVASPLYWPFFYAYTLYNPMQADPAHTRYRETYRRQDLVQDWVRYLKGRVGAGDVYEFLYELPPADVRLALRRDLSQEEEVRTRRRGQHNELLQYAAQPGRAELLAYLLLCKDVEELLGEKPNEDEEWEERDPDHDEYADIAEVDSAAALSPAGQALVTRLRQQLTTTRDAFLRPRYAYQWLVICRYAKAWQQGIAVYERYLQTDLRDAELRYWALHHAGRCYAKAGNQALADLLQARVFFHSSAKQEAAEVHFAGKDLEKTLALAENADDSACVVGLKALRTPAYVKAPLRQLYHWIGGRKPLQVLVAREIAKLEEFYPTGHFLPLSADSSVAGAFSDTWYSYNDEPAPGRGQDQRQLQLLLDLCLTAATEPIDRPAWALMSAHLLFLAGRHAEADIWLTRALREPTATAVQREQARVTRILLLVRPGLRLSTPAKHQLAGELGWMLRHNTFGRCQDVLAVVREQLQRTPDRGAGLLLGLLDYPKPTLANSFETMGEERTYSRTARERFYVARLDVPALTAMAQALGQLTPDPLVALVLKHSPGARDLVLDELGSKHLLENRLEAALAAYALVAPAYWQQDVFRDYLNEDPTQIAYLHPYDTYVLPPARRYTKPAYVRQMLAIRQAAQRPSTEQARQCLALANMYYNLSEEGNSWIMVWRAQGGVSFYDEDHNALTTQWFEVDMKPEWERNYRLLADARTWYLKAAAAARTPEFGAACTWMACRCDLQARRVLGERLIAREDQYDSDQEAVRKRHYRQAAFAALFARYPQYANRLTSNCATYGKFIASNR